jgi:hypothetical protein
MGMSRRLMLEQLDLEEAVEEAEIEEGREAAEPKLEAHLELRRKWNERLRQLMEEK